MTGAFAANALDDDERREFEQHLAECDACRQEVAELQATTAMLAAAQEEAPPASMRAAVLDEIDRTRQERPVAPPIDLSNARLRRSWSSGSWQQRVLGAAAAVLAVALVGMGVVVSTLNDRLGDMEARSQVVQELLAAPDSQTVTMNGPGDSTARVLLSRQVGQAVMFGHGMAPAPAGHDYELWFIHEDAFVAAGLLTVHEDGTVSHTADGDLEGVVALGVTVEPAGGSPQPTTDPVMLAELSA